LELTAWAHDWSLFDPKLTDKGIGQCKSLAGQLEASFPYAKDECRIVVSPLTRTLETVHHSLGWLLEQGVRVDARAEWQVGYSCVHYINRGQEGLTMRLH
jgi:broad specificity phosphatase PhoE